MSIFYGGLVNGNIRFDEVPTAGVFAGSDFPLPPCRVAGNYSAGTLLDQLDGVSFVLLTLAVSTPQNFDLLALLDAFGASITVARLRFAMFKNLSTIDGPTIKLGNSGGNEFAGIVSAGGTMSVYPGTAQNDGWLIWNAPNTTAAVTNSTHRLIKADPGTAAQNMLGIFGTASV